LQQDAPGDYVVASGETHTVREFCELAFAEVGLDWERYVVIDEQFVRAPEPVQLVGDPAKARRQLEWSPQYTFRDLVAEMVREDAEKQHS
ncbi:MAG TPA: GDP-mannose 4,6-dehydratase, partial [Thermoanaerobaculia bacterium]|nr:GDP-mannose 4,6-dehydratase [Thermoanaerobaculia bacterium]